ncbi:MAG: hypothetical protein C4536_08950 [Actinobacteria bacterium]|jgi:hypothetical protein|nr:MAG: hypothetical protein C4536_08950 [Actinomycetota bacterium]
MTTHERIETAIRLGKPDRVPVVPIIDFFSARYGGITQHEMLFDLEKADAALEKTLRDLGPIDGQHLSFAGFGRIFQLVYPTPPLLPGVDGFPDDAEYQFVEKSVMEPEEYRRIAERGANRWILDKLRINHPQLRNPIGMARELAKIIPYPIKMRRSMRAWRKRGVESIVAYNFTFTPMEFISLALRSFNDFVLDIFRYPEDIKAASAELMKPMKMLGMFTVGISRIRRIFMGGTRTSASFLSPKQFEEFALPEWQEMCEYWVGKGITPLLHLDSDWTGFFPYLKNLPRGKCILNLDGTSNIFAAKDQLGDHMCIMGDVPATMLKLGEPEEVEEYCRKLITELGADGGFILSSGCTIPVDAKPENVKAMLQSVLKYK